MNEKHFSQSILEWFDVHGRKNLPWQINKTPYRVWVSEIMLQQTQVTTVIGYYNRFMDQFKSLEELAKADEDDVLGYWAGLGYYARARNLHKTAKLIVSEYDGEFPSTLDEIESLPGIGRSTAGAILSLSLNQRAPILDGNVKRVLARFHAIEGWTGHPSIAKELWYWAERYTPKTRFSDYTQAMMDLGATLCTRSKPNCPQCPINSTCRAYNEDRTNTIPTPKPKKALPVKHRWLLHIENQKGEIYIEKRPPSGIWGSLWSLPDAPYTLDGNDITHYCREQLAVECTVLSYKESFKHTFSHYHLILHPIKLSYVSSIPSISGCSDSRWLKGKHQLGLPAPIKIYIDSMEEEY
ncbi:A/G-specific adenine glycosylase [Alkalimarinus alittae]|uniref:Adenine DNA glycosylase n=1 Tax=Alkalimarinus alittae TaxID=2961619 RepID=A0ABY6N4W1_9ALTE|nr:A/G-specific adenine glycosylase [Alkalimarinus alittae]UZE97022.1 A/G-specific adenine glycosylase [Alkalimarinus alittae]